MGEPLRKLSYHKSIFVDSVSVLWSFCFVFSPNIKFTGHLTRIVYFFAANRGTTAGSSGDEIGKALASVSFSFLAVFFFGGGGTGLRNN